MSSWALPQRTDRESRYSELRHAADLQTVAYWYLARDAEAVEAGLMPAEWRMTPAQAWEHAEMYWRDHVEAVAAEAGASGGGVGLPLSDVPIPSNAREHQDP